MPISNQKWLQVYKESQGKCFYCEKDLNDGSMCIDHIKPKAHGGDNDLSNLVMSCRSCNSAKGTKSVDLYLKILKIKKHLDSKFDLSAKVLIQKDDRYSISGVLHSKTPEVLIEISKIIL